MDEKRRLGPQDPLGWIMGTREERTEDQEHSRQSAVRETLPMERKRAIGHPDKSIPMEVKVMLKGKPTMHIQTITLEFTEGQKQPQLIYFLSCYRQSTNI
jgi:hypothetical protein